MRDDELGPLPTAAFVEEDLSSRLCAESAHVQYDGLAVTDRGRILNADTARELSPFYSCYRERIAFTSATYPPASRYVLSRFREKIVSGSPASMEHQRRVLFLAGGPGSGKSSIAQEVIESFDLVFDSNFADFEKARSLVELARRSHWEVAITYVHRPYRNALRDMIRRAEETGRYIPLNRHNPSSLAELHFSAQRTFCRISELFAEDIGVTPRAFSNPWTREKPRRRLGPLQVSDLCPPGRHHYHSLDAIYDEQDQTLSVYGALPPELREALRL